MGETIVMSIPGSSYCWIAFGIGILSFILLLFCGGPEAGSSVDALSKKAALIWLAVTLMIVGAGVAVHRTYDIPKSEANYEAAMNRLQAMQTAYQEPFFLKEEVCEAGVWGEIKGNIVGFIFFAGKIYGSIDSGRVVTVVYEDSDPVIEPITDVHRSLSFHLDHVAIKTISAGERPYLSYPESRIDTCGCDNSQLTLVPGTPYLYLPEGWEIL